MRARPARTEPARAVSAHTGNDPWRKIIGPPCRGQSIPRPGKWRRYADAPTAALLTGLRGWRMVSASLPAHTPFLLKRASGQGSATPRLSRPCPVGGKRRPHPHPGVGHGALGRRSVHTRAAPLPSVGGADGRGVRINLATGFHRAYIDRTPSPEAWSRPSRAVF